jgi:hypothetical protein
MDSQRLLDVVPIPVVFLLLVIGGAGFVALGRWLARGKDVTATDDDDDGAVGLVLGALLGLLGFLLAVTMGMAADRFDARRAVVLDEANGIGTAYLRAGFLPAAERDQVRNLFREYAPLRVNIPDREQLLANFDRSEEILAELWTIAEAVRQDTPPFALFADSLNTVIDLHATRVSAIVYARVPPTVLVVLLVGAALTLGMLGYVGRFRSRGSRVATGIMIAVLSVVFTLIIDLDRPRDGFLVVSQQPLIDLAEDIGPPVP